MSDPAISPAIAPVATALADEGVPLRVISRSMRVPAEQMRSHLRLAVDNGELIEMPAEDWPPTAKRLDRMPQPTMQQIEHLTIQVRAAFKVTTQQAVVFAALLTRNEAKKEQLLAAIQHHRVSKSALPNDLEEPQIKLIDVVICNLRKRVKAHGISIDTVWGSGYAVSRASRDLALRLIGEYAAGDEQAEAA